MSTIAVDSHLHNQVAAWWFLDTLVVEHQCAPGMATVVLEMTLPVGSTPPLHVHDNLDDSWYILEGEMVLRCGEDERIVSTGHWVSMPRGLPHTFRVIGNCNARILMVHDNASFRDLVRELGIPAETRLPPEDPVFPPMPDLVRLAAAYDLTPIGPPMSLEDADAIVASIGSSSG
jgi:mannose-6-phosphate isomerase-like protein (cupin superfamily)